MMGKKILGGLMVSSPFILFLGIATAADELLLAIICLLAAFAASWIMFKGFELLYC